MLKFTPDDLPDFDYKSAVKRPVPIKCVRIHQAFEVETLEGVMKGKAGDWLMIGVDGELYPCDNEIFNKTYILQI